MAKAVCRFSIVGLVVSLLSVAALSASAQGMSMVKQAETSGSKFQFKDICIRSLFGINDEVLADTDRFPLNGGFSSIELGVRFGDFTNATVTISKDRDTGKPGLAGMRFYKEFGPETDDKELLREYERTVDLVSKLLGVKVECRGLADSNANVRRLPGVMRLPRLTGGGRITSRTSLHLAKGQLVEIAATEASYVIRSGQPIQTAAPIVSVWFCRIPFGTQRSEGDDAESVKELTLGLDYSELLSVKMRVEKEELKLQELKTQNLKKRIAAIEADEKATAEDQAKRDADAALEKARAEEEKAQREARQAAEAAAAEAAEATKSGNSVAETNNTVKAEKASVAEKLETCDFLLNKDFKKNAKYYLCLFSASWCPPCRREMPRIAKTYLGTLKDDPDIELIHFSRDQNDDKALAWAKKHDVKFPVVKPNGGNPLDLKPSGIPHLFILKADGTLVEHDHPMRIFNEEKFRELKGGVVKTFEKSKTAGEREDGTEEVNGVKWNYKIVDGEVVLSGSYCENGMLAVPKDVSGALVIPEALGGFPVRRIEGAAFRYCTGLTSVTIPACVTNIKGNPFDGCRGIETFVVASDNPNFKSVNGLLCSKDGKKIIAGVNGDLVIPECVDTIGKSAFYAYWGLKSVTIPPSVRNIEPLAFYNSGLTSVTIPEGVLNIGNDAFGDCWGLTSVAISSSVASIGHRAFSACSGKLNSISVSPGNMKYASLNGLLCSKDGKTIIAGIDGDVTIHDGVTSINDGAFYKCMGLITVSIPASVTRIGDSAFEWCDKIKSFAVSPANPKYASLNSLLCTKDGRTLIAGVNGEVIIPEGVTTITESAFSGRNALTSVTIPSSVTKIGEEAFRCCRGLTSVKMLGERPVAERQVFAYCGKLKSIHVPADAKSWAGMKEWQGIPLVFDGDVSVVKSDDSSVADVVANKPVAEKISVAEKLGTCDFLLNKDFKKNAKYYLCLFSASWCPPCRREMPRIAKTYVDTLKDDPDIELIHFSRDQDDDKALAWAKEHDVKFPVVKPKGGNPLDLRCSGIPHLFILKADGTLVEHDHPMRIFNEEKLKEIKSGNIKPRTADADLKSGERTEQVDGYTWTYRVENGCATIVAAGGKRRCTISPRPTGCIIIPSKLGGLDVARIGSEAFCECSGMTSVKIPETVKEICWRAFSECGSLTSVSIPAGVTKIYSSAFSGCKSLTAITVSAENTQYASRDGILFDKSMKTLVCYPGGIQGAFVMPAGVTEIGDSAFSGCAGLTSVIVPDSVTRIGDYAFSKSRALTSVSLGRGVAKLGDAPFYWCSGLTSITVSEANGRYASRDGVLFDKDMKTVICCPGGLSGKYIIPSTVTSIGRFAFDSCKKLTAVTIPPSVVKIDYHGFNYCEVLTSVVIPASVMSIGDWAFCRALREVTISEGVKAIGVGAFCQCYEMTSVTIPASVTSVGKYAFSGCSKLETVVMRGERPELGEKAFGKCDSLKAIHVPANAKSWAGMKEWQGIPLVFDGDVSVVKSDDSSVADVVANKPVAEKISVAEKLGTCDFLLNKDFKKNAKYYLCLFSASWCPPCRREMPRIAKTYLETLKDDPDIELIHFSRDQNDDKALAWAKEHDVKFPVVKPNGGNPLDLKPSGIPHLFILKADGTLVEHDHPMRIFNEEKFSEIKSGNVKVKPHVANVELKNGEGAEQVGGYLWTYRMENGCATIVAAGGLGRCTISPVPHGDVVIPAKLGDMSVTSIGDFAFWECGQLTSATIPSSVKSICAGAFWNCRGMTSVKMLGERPAVGSQLFAYCGKLKEIHVPADAKSWAGMKEWQGIPLVFD